MDPTNLHFGSWHKHYTLERTIDSFNCLEVLPCSFTGNSTSFFILSSLKDFLGLPFIRHLLIKLLLIKS